MSEKPNIELSAPPKYGDNDATQGKSSRKCCTRFIIVLTVVAVSLLTVASLTVGVVFLHKASYQVKMYHTRERNGMTSYDQDIEIDTYRNVLIFHLSGEGIGVGTLAVIDYTKSMTGIYDTLARKCLIVGGIQQQLTDPKTFKEMLEKNMTQSGEPTTTLQYQVSHTYPVNDKSILPTVLQRPCARIPVYWLEPESKIQKRGCINVCFGVLFWRTCYDRCW
jgi:hypothetical protein